MIRDILTALLFSVGATWIIIWAFQNRKEIIKFIEEKEDDETKDKEGQGSLK